VLVPGLGCQYILLSGSSENWIEADSPTHWTLTLERDGHTRDTPIECLPEASGRPGFQAEVVIGRLGVEADDEATNKVDIKYSCTRGIYGLFYISYEEFTYPMRNLHIL
jgi:hypothetical protein